MREEEKEKYAEMAREWRAAQVKEAGPPEKQVKLAWEEQLPVGNMGMFTKCWMSEWLNAKGGTSGWFSLVQRRIFHFFFPGVRMPVKKPAVSLTRAHVVIIWWWKAGGILIRKPATNKPWSVMRVLGFKVCTRWSLRVPFNPFIIKGPSFFFMFKSSLDHSLFFNDTQNQASRCV